MMGADAVRAWMEPDALDEQRIEPREFRIKELDMWNVWTVNDDGLATRVEGFLDHQESEALEAAGLSE